MKALNTGPNANHTAIMIGRAFDYMDKMRRADIRVRDAYRKEHGNLHPETLINDYVDSMASDRRFKVHYLAGTSDFSSAIIRYRNVEYYVEGVWDSFAKERNYYVYFRYAG